MGLGPSETQAIQRLVIASFSAPSTLRVLALSFGSVTVRIVLSCLEVVALSILAFSVGLVWGGDERRQRE